MLSTIQIIFRIRLILAISSICVLNACQPNETKVNNATQKRSIDWPNYGGNKFGNRYSHLSQINVENVKNLTVAWVYDSEKSGSVDSADLKNSQMECQPIVVNGILYGTSPKLKLFALDAGSGKKIWEFDPFFKVSPKISSNRGVFYWENGQEKRIFFTASSSLYAVDAVTGTLVNGFGSNGVIDLHVGLDNHHDVHNLYVASTSPGVIYKNTLVLGSALSEGGDAPPGYVRGFDVQTGRLKWVFHTIPEPGEFGYDTWPKDAYKYIGAANNWSGLTVDEKRGAIYLGTGSPACDYYGGDRQGTNLFSDCILSLDAETGKLIWYYQTIHHDLWDRDIPCPPNLATIILNGKKTDVVVQATKDGLVFVLDRDSGNSIFPVEEKLVPTEGLPGEHPWPVQKFPVRPLPLSNQVFSASDITDISPESHEYIKKMFDSTRHSNKFLPPGEKGTLLYGYSGGAEWGGNAIDSNGILYQNANNAIWKLQMEVNTMNVKEIASLPKGHRLYITHCSPCHGNDMKGNGNDIPGLIQINKRLSETVLSGIMENGRRRMPSFKQLLPEEKKSLIQFLINPDKSRDITDDFLLKKAVNPTDKKGDFPYKPTYRAKFWVKVFDPHGYPAVKPPWGTLNAIDLKTGEYVWRIPLGEYPELTKKGIPITGTENYGGPIVTDGGLIFIAATRDEKIRAIDRNNGKTVWEYTLPAAGFATPITYEVNGRQYIVIAAGGGRGLKSGSSYIAFALPFDK